MTVTIAFDQARADATLQGDMPDGSGVGVNYVDVIAKASKQTLPDGRKLLLKRKGLKLTLAIGDKQGEALLTRDCARCHAVGPSGSSPRTDAPAFRTLSGRYPIESLEEALGEGIMSGHPDMPEFKYDADEVGVIIDYLKSIQQR